MPCQSLRDIAEFIGGHIEGDDSIKISSVAPLDQAGCGEITFITGSKFLSKLAGLNASALIAPLSLDTSAFSGVVLRHSNPYLAYAKTVQLMYPEPRLPAVIHASAVVADDVEMGEQVAIAAKAVIDSGVKIGNRVQIGAGCVVGAGCVLEDDVCLKANVTLYEGVTIGARTRLHSGAVIGADGFGYAPDAGKWEKIPQIGAVTIGEDVEIGANTTIDRGALSNTIIGNGVIIDNQVQIGHNIVIGDQTAIAGAAAIAGSTVIGKRCQIAGAAAIAGHITIADDVTVTGMSMVAGSIKQKGVYSSGTPVTDSRRWRKNAVRFTQLDDITKTVRELRKQIQGK
ncbi:MAG: UDP-3-O-(3-hydroxymyristoyl)glucosamine N-acyltransferase [Proteobacteria bacterium]|nr:MAG: UDP-3-O-(3-hydroxymyristoyl)glucosamine N-acyltransferase [Pseudomonadota bacterium]